MRSLLLPFFVSCLALHAASCKSGGQGGRDDGSEVAAADALSSIQGVTDADRAAFNKSLQPLQEDKGWNSTCDGCMAFWALQENPNKVNDPIYDWNALQRKCLEKGQCKNVFENTQAWSSVRFIAEIARGPSKRWATYRKEGKKLVCLYEHPYHTGAEVCYEGPGRAILPDKLKGKVSSYQIENLGRIYARGGSIEKYQPFINNEGYNLLPDYNDKIEEIIILAR